MDILEYYQRTKKIREEYIPSKLLERLNHNGLKISPVKHENFYMILDFLGRRGPSTLTEITCTAKISENKRKSWYRIVHRIINGDHLLNIEGQIKKGLVIKEDKKYYLSDFGLLYLLSTDYDFNNSNDMKYNESFTDYSHQRKKRTILDDIDQFYHKQMPLIFDNLGFLKANSMINLNTLFDVLYSLVWTHADLDFSIRSKMSLSDVLCFEFFYLALYHSYNHCHTNFNINNKAIKSFVSETLEKLKDKHKFDCRLDDQFLASVQGNLF